MAPQMRRGQRASALQQESIPPEPRRSPRLRFRESPNVLTGLEPEGRPEATNLPDEERHSASERNTHKDLPPSRPVEAWIKDIATPTKSSRKRKYTAKLESGPATISSKRACLTRGNLKVLEKMGRNNNTRPSQNGENIRRRLAKSVSSQSQRSISQTSSSRTNYSVSTTDPKFADKAMANGIMHVDGTEAPLNIAEIRERMDRSRDTASPTEEEFEDFLYKSRADDGEGTNVLNTSKRLLKDYVGKYRQAGNIQLIDFPRNVGFNDGLSVPQPDIIEGLDRRTFLPFPVREELGGAAVVRPGPLALTLSHFAGELKGPGQSMVTAGFQAAYDGAALVYGRDEARRYMGKPDPVGHSFVSTFICDGSSLKMFAHYSSSAPGESQIKYHQYQITSTFLESYDEFKLGRRRLRNLQDRAKDNVYALRDELVEHWTMSLADHAHGSCLVDDSSLDIPEPSANSMENNKSQGLVDQQYDPTQKHGSQFYNMRPESFHSSAPQSNPSFSSMPPPPLPASYVSPPQSEQTSKAQNGDIRRRSHGSEKNGGRKRH